jgi:two-component system chemotaxis family response regulator WspR
MVISSDNAESVSQRLLVIEPDPATVRLIAAALDQGFGAPGERVCERALTAGGRRKCAKLGDGACRIALTGSLRDLYEFDIADVEIVICAVSLPDGSGLDALAYLRGLRPDLPVILTGTPNDAPLAVEAIRAGAMDFLVTSGVDMRTLPLAVEKCLAHQRIKHENERLQRDLARSLAELEVKNQQLETVIRQLESMARTDELTGLANRRWLNLMLEGSWAEATRNDLPMAFLMLDLDGFKALNDEMGHQRGDEVLRLVAKVIEANCRDVDVCARYGGDEFCVLMPHTEPEEALLVAQRVLREFRSVADRLPADEPPIGMSVGMSHIDLSHPVRAEQLVIHADEALYGAKQSGKNCVMVRNGNGVFPPATLVE